jgi:AraC-like DNA-binding protein
MSESPFVPRPVREQIQLELHHVEEISYPSLNILDMVRPDWILSFVLEGRVETRTGNETAVAHSGDVMVHPPHLHFAECSSRGGTHQWFAFHAQVWPQIDLLSRYPLPFVVRLSSPDYSARFGELRRAWEAPPTASRDTRCCALVLELLSLVLESWQQMGSPARAASTGSTSGRFDVVLRFMNEQLHRKITRDELARLVHLHPGYFDRVFRAHYGMAPTQMVRALRLRRAQELLESTSDTMESIARQCGFGDAAHFSHVFRARLGQTPNEYRRGAKQTRESYLRPMSP